MSLEDEVKEAFTKHADDARADSRAWSAVERKVRRAHYQRVALVSTMTVALIAAAAVLVPRLGSRTQSHGFVDVSSSPSAVASDTPTAAPSPTTTVPVSDVPIGWTPRVGVQSFFRLAIPADWKGGWFEGTWDFEPAGLPSTSQDGDTFAVSVTVQHGDYHWAAGSNATTSLTIGGRDALMWSTDALHRSYSIDWPGCTQDGVSCSAGANMQTAIVNMFASTDALWKKYERTGTEIVSGLSWYDGSSPIHGTVSDGVATDAFSKVLVRFLDARVEGIGADELMCCEAPGNYSNLKGLYELDGKKVISYKVTDRSQGGSATQEQLGVTVTFSGGTTRIELIGVDQTSTGDAPQISSMCSTCGGL